MMRSLLAFICVGLGVLSTKAQQAEPLFSLLPPESTGIDFENTLTDEKDHNILIYSNYYGGGGVGIIDINRDGLSDIYFAGNLVGDRLYLNEGNFKFKDITQAAGITDNGGWSSGVVIVDVNQDGYDDIYVTRELYDDQPDLRKNVLYLNNGDLTFAEKAAEYGIDDAHRTRHATFLDYDRDGDPDLFCLNQPPNPGNFSPLAGTDLFQEQFTPRLYRNNGPGRPFTEVTAQAGLVKPGFANSVSACDFNRDGWTDLYVSNDYDAADRLWLNQQDGSFVNVIDSAMRHLSFYSMGVDAADINHDGWLDIMVLDMVAEDNFRLKANMSGMNPQVFWDVVDKGEHYQYMYNTLHLNQGTSPTNQQDVIFSDIAQLSGVPSTDWSWSNLFADFDNDGHQDIHVTNGLLRDIRNTDADKKVSKFINKTITDFIQENPNAGEVTIWDILDLEKALSILPSVPLPNYAYRNKGGLEFEKVSENWGLDQKAFSNGSAYGDLDNDGDLDLIVNNINAPAFVYRNNASGYNGNNWLGIYLQSDQTTFGTKVRVKSGNTTQFQEHTNVRGMYSTSQQVLHFGLGKNEYADTVEVVWPDGKITQTTHTAANQVLNLYHKDAKPAPSKETKEATPYFEAYNAQSKVDFRHVENPFDDYKAQVLLPHKMSQFGPGLAVADVNGDGREDFFVGGAIRQPGALYMQAQDGSFMKVDAGPWEAHKPFEDLGATFFDADSDGDQDLYVVSGGNEYPDGSGGYMDRLYLNTGKNFEFVPEALPKGMGSGSRVKPFDFDGDGDLDLFVGGRLIPQAYPRPASSYLLRNDSEKGEAPRFTDVTKKMAPALKELGMVTDAVWTDFNGDDAIDLVVVGEWMPVSFFENRGGEWVNVTAEMGMANQTGWWYSLTAEDIDGDGDEDLVAGNLGLNYKYQASEEEPFAVHYDDFDDNGSEDIVLSYYNYGECYPLRGRSCSSEQVPEIKEKFPSYTAFAGASLEEVYGIKSLKKALHYEAKTFASTLFENLGEGQFQATPLPREAQLSSINDILVEDIDRDGNLDLLVAGNLFVSEIETPRNDAGVGLWLKRDHKGNYTAVSPFDSGLRLPYDVKDLEIIQTPQGRLLLAACNDDLLRVFRIK